MSARRAQRLVPFAYGFRPFFLLYLVIYAPILLAPRVDGKPG